jgi:signal transduction histidine kinase
LGGEQGASLAGLRGSLTRSSAFRLTMSYTTLFGLSVLVVLTFIYWTTAQAISRQTDDTITAEIDALYQHYDTEGLDGLVHTIEERTRAQTLAGGLYLLTDASLHRITGNVANWPVAATSANGWLTFGLTGRSDEAAFGRGRSFFLPGGYRLLVGRDMRALERFQSLMVETMAWACAGTLILGIVGGFAFSRRVVARLEAINGTAGQIMQGDITHRVPLSGRGDEFDRLAITLNAMLDQIEQLMAGIRTVTNNIAHDLRSPLTRMRSQLERAMVSAEDAESLRETCAQVIGEADTLLTTFNALLSIAEAEAGTRLSEAAPVDMAALVEDVVDLYGPLAEDDGLTLTMQIEATTPAPQVTGSRELLFQALANILDNAIKYTPAPGTIEVRVGHDGQQITLEVLDDGPGIPPQDRDRVLDRFVRLDASRSTPGNGLGLSLVVAIGHLHHATLSLHDGIGTQAGKPGLGVRMAFPTGV